MIYDDNRGRDQQDVTEMLDGIFWLGDRQLPVFSAGDRCNLVGTYLWQTDEVSIIIGKV